MTLGFPLLLLILVAPQHARVLLFMERPGAILLVLPHITECDAASQSLGVLRQWDARVVVRY